MQKKSLPGSRQQTKGKGNSSETEHMFVMAKVSRLLPLNREPPITMRAKKRCGLMMYLSGELSSQLWGCNRKGLANSPCQLLKQKTGLFRRVDANMNT